MSREGANRLSRSVSRYDQCWLRPSSTHIRIHCSLSLQTDMMSVDKLETNTVKGQWKFVWFVAQLDTVKTFLSIQLLIIACRMPHSACALYVIVE